MEAVDEGAAQAAAERDEAKAALATGERLLSEVRGALAAATPKVTIQGLQKASLNGCHGRILDVDGELGRFRIQLDDAPGRPPIKVKPENVMIYAAAQ